MNEAIARMLARYQPRHAGDYIDVLREILQEIALLGLWRAKFFEKAAFYGGTSLRILYRLDRFSEDLDFSLLSPTPDFKISKYSNALVKEMESFGFDVAMEAKDTPSAGSIQSAFLKTNTVSQLLSIGTAKEIGEAIPHGKLLKIKLEVDTDPPPGFATETKYLLQPIPFAVRTYTLPDLFAGKMHAILCRRWKTRVKGRDWYDLVWFIANHPQLRLSHLEKRLVQTGDWQAGEPLNPEALMEKLADTINQVDLEKASREVAPFLKDGEKTAVWSREFFQEIIKKIEFV
ncbi:MAG: nucleotidyl transferase AbiEii/AbiGii toxin family protein [Syntrophaceae bacterium]|nr:nucleotidyl transferase AbiEii/AbiGii toxin family protein [Syntrophaceae bacterium]